jgi:hypothetical protein
VKIALLLTLGATMASGALGAQTAGRPHRSGLWGEFAFGPGIVRVACSECTDVIGSNGATSHLRIGGTVSDHVLIGAELFSLLDKTFDFSLNVHTQTAETGTAAIVVLWYPGRRGLYFKGGVGAAVGQYTIPTSPTQADTSTGAGMGLTFGAGWDWSISRKLAVTFDAGTYVVGVGDIVLPGRRVDDVIATMYSASIGLTFR